MKLTNPNLADIPAHLSYSQASSYLDCPWAYYLEKVAQIELPPALWFAGGSALHHACDAVDHILMKEGK